MSQAENLDPYELEFVPLSPNIGAEIQGVDLSKPLTETLKEKIYQALLDHKVLFFRNQNLTTAEHFRFARSFGELEVHPFFNSVSGVKEILQLRHDDKNKGTENIWHSDVTWRKVPSLGSILRAIEVPATGGDTLWANMELAYDNLPDEMKKKLEGRVAIHDFSVFLQKMKERGASEEKLKEHQELYPPVEHPIIRTHPDTGKKSIYVNLPFTRRIKDMDEAESKATLAFLFHQAWLPEAQCRFRWEAGSIAFWDNRSSQHYAVSDYFPQVRIMERATIIGDKPV